MFVADGPRAAPQEASEKCACMRRRSDGVGRELVRGGRAGFRFLAWVVVAEQGVPLPVLAWVRVGISGLGRGRVRFAPLCGRQETCRVRVRRSGSGRVVMKPPAPQVCMFAPTIRRYDCDYVVTQSSPLEGVGLVFVADGPTGGAARGK